MGVHERHEPRATGALEASDSRLDELQVPLCTDAGATGGGSSAADLAASSATAAADDVARVVASAVSDLMSEAAAAAAATGVAMECSAAADAPSCNEEGVAATAATEAA